MNDQKLNRKVNKWMLRRGYVWDSKTNSSIGHWIPTPSSSHPPIDQDTAIVWFKTRPRLAQRLLRAVRQLGRRKNATEATSNTDKGGK